MEVNENSQAELLDEKVNNQAIDFLFERIPDAILKQLIIPFIFVAVLWQTQDKIHLITWAIVVVVVYISRFYLAKLYLKERTKLRSSRWWANKYVFSTVIMSLLWSYGTFVFFPQNAVAEQVFIITLVLALSAGTIYATAFWINALYAWSYPLLLVLTARLIMEYSYSYYFMSLLLIIYLVAITKIAKLTNKYIYDAIRLHFENTALIGDLRIEKEHAEEANRAKTRFLAAASHDLRQPLHALNLFSELLKRHATDNTQQEILDKVDCSLNSLNGMLDKLLDISRLDAGVLEKNIVNFNLRYLVLSLSNEFKNQCNDKGLELITQFSDCHVLSDPVLLEVILRNLLSNAIRYTNSGSVSLVCNQVNKSGEKLANIQVKDTGIGIKQENIEEIFSEYTQLNNPERDQSKGLGLGLAIVKRISELIGSEISIESSYGKGSVFSVTVPIGIEAPRAETAENNIDFNGLAVVIIDDDETILSAMADTLSIWGCNVLQAQTGDEAIMRIQENGFIPDVIISDYRLREGRNGASAIKDICELFDHEIAAYIITGDTAPERLREARASGYELLHKPLQPEKIRAALNKLNIQNRNHSLSLEPE